MRVSRLISTPITLSLLALSACGIATEGNDSERAQNQRYNERLEKAYSGVIGVYHGALTIVGPVTTQPSPPPGTPPKPEPSPTPQTLTGQMQIYVERVIDGYDRNGSPRTHPQLYAQLKLDSVGELDDTTFQVDYGQYDGKINLKQPSTSGGSSGSSPAPGSAGSNTAAGSVRACAVGPKDPELSMAGSIINGHFKGDVNGSSGTIGPVDMTRVSTTSKQPIRDQDVRLMKAFQKIVGQWQGDATIAAENKSPIPTKADVYLTIDQVSAGQGITCPVLNAQYRMENVVGRLDDTYLSVSYREGTGELDLTYKAPPANRSVCSLGPADESLALTTFFTKDDKGDMKLDGDISGRGGDIGKISNFHKVSENAIAPDDQRERINSVYKRIQGRWEGRTRIRTASTAQVDATGDIYVTIDEVVAAPNVTCPVLTGQFRLKDVVGKIDDTYLDVDYREGTGEIFFTAKAPPAGIRVCPIGPPDLKFAVASRVNDPKNPHALAGIITGQGGQIGDVNLVYTPGAIAAPDDQIERLTRSYEPLLGTWVGRYHGSGIETDFPVQFNLYMSRNQIDPFLSCPSLKGNYIRPDLVTTGAGQMVLDIQYLPVEKSLVMNSTTVQQPGGTTGLPGHTTMSVHSQFNGNSIAGNMAWWRYDGDFQVYKCAGNNPQVDTSGRCSGGVISAPPAPPAKRAPARKAPARRTTRRRR